MFFSVKNLLRKRQRVDHTTRCPTEREIRKQEGNPGINMVVYFFACPTIVYGHMLRDRGAPKQTSEAAHFRIFILQHGSAL